jgi:hypothetical protein
MKQTGVSPVTQCQAYRGYLIRSSARIIVREGQPGYWIEKDGTFIGWAKDEGDARRIIGELTDRLNSGTR